MQTAYMRRNSRSNGHEYTTLAITKHGRTRSLSYVTRHRSDCAACLASEITDQVLPERVDLLPWRPAFAAALEEGNRSLHQVPDTTDIHDTLQLLVNAGHAFATVPRSPDGGWCSEQMGKAGDCLLDAAWALGDLDYDICQQLVDSHVPFVQSVIDIFNALPVTQQ